MSRASSLTVNKIMNLYVGEEADVYMLSLYSLNPEELEFFRGKDRDKVKKIFKTLVEDTQRHSELLKLMAELAKDHGPPAS